MDQQPGKQNSGITQLEQQNKKRIKKNEVSTRDLWDNIMCPNTCIIGIQGGKVKGAERIFEEIMFENFPNLGKEIDIRFRKHREFQKR